MPGVREDGRAGSENVLDRRQVRLEFSSGPFRPNEISHTCGRVAALCRQPSHWCTQLINVLHQGISSCRLAAYDCCGYICRDVWWQEEVRKQSNDCTPEWVGAEDPLFLL